MQIEENWLQINYKKVREALKKTTASVDEVLEELGFTEEEKKRIRWAFI